MDEPFWTDAAREALQKLLKFNATLPSKFSVLSLIYFDTISPETIDFLNDNIDARDAYSLSPPHRPLFSSVKSARNIGRHNSAGVELSPEKV